MNFKMGTPRAGHLNLKRKTSSFFCEKHGWLIGTRCVACDANKYKERFEQEGKEIKLPDGAGPTIEDPSPSQIVLQARKLKEKRAEIFPPSETVRDRPVFSRRNLHRLH